MPEARIVGPVTARATASATSPTCARRCGCSTTPAISRRAAAAAGIIESSQVYTASATFGELGTELDVIAAVFIGERLYLDVIERARKLFDEVIVAVALVYPEPVAVG